MPTFSLFAVAVAFAHSELPKALFFFCHQGASFMLLLFVPFILWRTHFLQNFTCDFCALLRCGRMPRPPPPPPVQDEGLS